MFCSNCGSKTEDPGSFCTSCGNKLETDSQTNNKGTNFHHPENYKNIPQASTPSQSGNGGIFIGLGWAFFAISLLFIPILFGAGAFIMGYLVRKDHSETHGTIIMIMAVGGAIFGMLLGLAASGY